MSAVLSAPWPAARPAEATDRCFWRRLLPLLAGLALLTRLPSFARPLWNPDEGYLAVQARMLAAGGALYETVVDRKPPLLPWLYEAVFALCGDHSLLPLRLLAALAQLVTAATLASIAYRRWGERAGRTAGVLYLLVSIGLNPEDTQAATFEVFMLPATALAVWCADRGRWGAAGAAVAVAALTKQTGGAALPPVLWLLCRYGRQGGSPAPRALWPGSAAVPPDQAAAALRLALGLAGPVAVAALATGPAGFWFWTVTGSGRYASPAGSELHVIGRAVGNALLVAAACAGLIAPVVRLLRREGVRCRVLPPDLWVWLASSAVAVALGFHFFGHYYLQLLPPLALLGTAALGALPGPWLRTSALCSVASCAAFLVWGAVAPSAELGHAERVAAAVQQRTRPGDRVLFWGMHPEQYWLADRPPASRFLTAGLLTNYSGGRLGAQVGERYAVPGSWPVFRRELRADPPTLIVDDSRGKPYGPYRTPTLRAFLAAYYAPAVTVDGAVLYARLP